MRKRAFTSHHSPPARRLQCLAVQLSLLSLAYVIITPTDPISGSVLYPRRNSARTTNVQSGLALAETPLSKFIEVGFVPSSSTADLALLFAITGPFPQTSEYTSFPRDRCTYVKMIIYKVSSANASFRLKSDLSSQASLLERPGETLKRI